MNLLYPSATGKTATRLNQVLLATAIKTAGISLFCADRSSCYSQSALHRRSLLLTLALLLTYLLANPVYAAQAKPKNEKPIQLSIAVAANFKPTMDKLLAAYGGKANQSLEYPALEFVISSGSTGQLFAQINHGAPYDLFFSADDNAPQRLVDLGKAQADSKRIYVKGQLAYWQPKSNAQINQQSLQAALGEGHLITLANPKFAPYGVAAQTVIDSLGENDAKSHKLITANNIAHSFQLIDSRQVHGGFVALSYLVAKKIDPAQYWLIPRRFYSEIIQSVVVLSRSTEPKAAKALLEFLTTIDAKTILREDGYLLEME